MFFETRAYCRVCNEVAIQEQFERAAGVPRQQALQKRRVTNDRVPLVCSWNEHLPDLRRILRQYFPVLQSEASLEQCFTAPPPLSFQRPRNLRDILVYGTQKNTSAQDAPIGTHKCLHSRCLTCPIVKNITQIQTNSGLKHIRARFMCDTSPLVCVITCSKCNSVYVGETGQKLCMCERMNGHRADIKNKNNTPVGLHFNAKGHEPRISGLQKNSSRHNSEESPREEVDHTSWIVQNIQMHDWTETRALTSLFCNSPILLIERCQQVLVFVTSFHTLLHFQSPPYTIVNTLLHVTCNFFVTLVPVVYVESS